MIRYLPISPDRGAGFSYLSLPLFIVRRVWKERISVTADEQICVIPSGGDEYHAGRARF